MNRQGYMIVLRPRISFNRYCGSDFKKKNQVSVDKLRDTLYFIKPENYAGTGRGDLFAWPFSIDNDGVLQDYSDLDPPATVQRNTEAKKLLAIYENKNRSTDNDSLHLHSLDEARQVFALLEDREEYEIIEIKENEAIVNERTLGFDVGYLGGDFSAIADTAITPTWCPPDFADMDDVIGQLKKLNDDCLFNSLEEAKAYRQLYLSKQWADKESYEGQTTIMQVRKA